MKQRTERCCTLFLFTGIGFSRGLLARDNPATKVGSPMQQSSLRPRAPARRRFACRALLAAIALLMGGTLASPQFAVSAAIAPTILGTAQSFLVLGGSTVTNTGPTTVTGGNLGVSPGTAITGFPPGIVVAPGSIHAADAVAAQAQSDVTTAYTTLAGQAPSATLTGQDLGGKTLTQGVYFYATSAQLTGQLTLDAKGDPSAVFVFQIGSTLVTASNASVLLTNGASPCNVYWQIGSSATLGTTTAFKGNIVALTSIGLNTGATVTGRALARNGAVTLDTNTFIIGGCMPTTTPPVVTPPVVTPPIVTPPVVVPPVTAPVVIPPVVTVPGITPPGIPLPVVVPPVTAPVVTQPVTTSPGPVAGTTGTGTGANVPVTGPVASTPGTAAPPSAPNVPSTAPKTGGGWGAESSFVRRLGDG